MDTLTILQPFMELIEEPELREKVEDTARIYFNGDGTTVNLIPALIIGLLLLIGLLKLLGLPILASFGIGGGDSDGGYGTTGKYTDRQTRLVSSLMKRLWPMSFSGGSGSGFNSGYGQAYARGDNYFDQTVADLQQQINQLIESNEALTNQVYYNVGGSSANSAGLSSNLLSSS